jgi:hypothetical protein
LAAGIISHPLPRTCWCVSAKLCYVMIHVLPLCFPGTACQIRCSPPLEGCPCEGSQTRSGAGWCFTFALTKPKQKILKGFFVIPAKAGIGF